MTSQSPFFVHESSFTDPGVEIGEGTKIWHFCHVLSGSRIGRKCVIGQNVSIGPDAVIGDRCKLQNNVSVFKGVTLEDEVFCGPSCVFTNVYNPRAFIERKSEFRLTLVKRGATIGANATIICGATIGRYSLVAAGAVVKSDVPDYALVAGVPARQAGWVCKCGTTLRFRVSDFGFRRVNATDDDYRAPAIGSETLTCQYCGNEYILHEGRFEVIREK
jgi:UDP-2-acetamido-3-amino-2,3-dideoxy-glucuronate N-acetyltransferase